MRATRMSVVDFWKNETLGDGFNIRVAHGVNSWPDLVDQLHDARISHACHYMVNAKPKRTSDATQAQMCGCLYFIAARSSHISVPFWAVFVLKP
ncbi:hypothetical protein ANCDUO_15019 [Ancylostoma duodenale]|uniref:Uncharacterized protein n=1 Tax=Ancylostoma duodenale TaxID=51022 RepID=A0A0C2CYC8_9BILA|nr:hypothetical protein ANCDUO_15019 [Ancylostoma duodenale]